MSTGLKPTTPTAGWWICDQFFDNGGRALVGPFSARLDAMTARSALESLTSRNDLFVDEYAKAPVELPTEPTLGWATWEDGRDLILTGGNGRGGTGYSCQRYIDSTNVTSFTEAVAVPKAALAELLRVSERQQRGELSDSSVAHAAYIFLRSVDEANGCDQ